MKKCLLWGNGRAFNNSINLLKYYEDKHEIDIIGVTSNDQVLKKYLGYDFIPQNQIPNIDFDIVIVMAEKPIYNQICIDASKFGIPNSQLIFYKLLGYPWFDIDKYVKLKKSNLSIFANNCWGGITYNSLNLQFCSPFIDMYTKWPDYMKFLKNPKYYVAQDIEFIRMDYDYILQHEFPVSKCGDIELYFNHSTNFESAIENWSRRKQRINWDNILIMSYTDIPEYAEEFIGLPYNKKICFTPFQHTNPAVCYIDFMDKMPNTPLWAIVNNILAKQVISYYNLLDLLLDGEINLI